MPTLNNRERTLFWLCLGAFFIAANIFAINIVSKRIRGARSEVTTLDFEAGRIRALLFQRSEAEERQSILDSTLPTLESAGKTQGQILESLQNEIRDRRFESEKQTLIEPKSYDHYEEVAVSVEIKGDAAEINRWLIGLQKANEFYIIKNLELELDKKSEKKEPQAICNLTLARWFKPLTS